MKKNTQNELLEEKIQMYKKDFEELNGEEKKLLAYRKIIELYKNGSLSGQNEKQLNSYDNVLAIIKAADYECGFIGPMFSNYKCKIAQKNREIYKESLISYNKVLNNYKDLSRELNINSSLELSHLFTYMLWNGYYSVTKEHTYKMQDILLIPGLLSFDAIKGQGVCLAYASLLHDYLKVCDKNSSILECKVLTGKKDVSWSYQSEIERNVENNISSRILNIILSPFIKILTNKLGDHAVTLIEENDKLFIYDPTNSYVLNIKNSDIATIINGKGDFKLKPFSALMVTSDMADMESIGVLEKLLFDSINPAFNKKEIISTFENIMELIQDNKKLLDDAYDNIHCELEFIEKQTNEFGDVREIARDKYKVKDKYKFFYK